MKQKSRALKIDSIRLFGEAYQIEHDYETELEALKNDTQVDSFKKFDVCNK